MVPRVSVAAFLAVWLLTQTGCHRASAPPEVVAITDVTATEQSRGLHAGLWQACKELHYTRYWNAPTHAVDFERQIELVDRHLTEATAGLILLPDSPTAPLTEVQKARDAGVPVVILHQQLAVDVGRGVYSVLDDYDKAARLAVTTLYQNRPGNMPVALTGVDMENTADLSLMHSFLLAMKETHPDASVTVVRLAGPGVRGAEEALARAVSSGAAPGGVFALEYDSAVAAAQRLHTGARFPLRLVALATDARTTSLLREGALDAVVAEDRFAMGYTAVYLLARLRGGGIVPSVTPVAPLLLTRELLPTFELRPPFNGRDR